LRQLYKYKKLHSLLTSSHSPSLTSSNYSHLFQALLWSEELKLESDMLEFSQESVTMGKVAGWLQLQVEGLEDGRPSFIEGDYVLAKDVRER
jgi:helicase MOV-10